MIEPIKNISLKFNCAVDWNSMEALGDGKYCNHCHKKVYDLTNSKQDEFLKLLAENNNNICGRFRQEQMSPTHPVLPAWKKWLSAAVVLIGINVFNNKAFAQGAPLKIAHQNAKTREADIVVGFVGTGNIIRPEFPGGFTAFDSFITKNIHYTKNMPTGKVIVTFTVETNGGLSSFKIDRGINTVLNNEAIRVLKLSPKWKPGLSDGKPVAVSCTIPISFSQ